MYLTTGNGDEIISIGKKGAIPQGGMTRRWNTTRRTRSPDRSRGSRRRATEVPAVQIGDAIECSMRLSAPICGRPLAFRPMPQPRSSSEQAGRLGLPACSEEVLQDARPAGRRSLPARQGAEPQVVPTGSRAIWTSAGRRSALRHCLLPTAYCRPLEELPCVCIAGVPGKP